MKIFTIIFFLVVGNGFCQAQNLSGTWVGKISRKTDTSFAAEKFELHLNQTRKEVEGYSFAFGNAAYYVLSELWGAYAKRQKDLLLKEAGYVFFKLPEDFEPCQKILELKYFQLENTEYLIGKWSGGASDSTICWSGHDLYVALQKVSKKRIERTTFVRKKLRSYLSAEEPEWKSENIDYYSLQKMRQVPEEHADTISLINNGMVQLSLDKLASDSVLASPKAKLDSVAIIKPIALKPTAAIVVHPKERATEIQQVLNIKDEYFKIHLYDNGYIDGDTVSIFANKIPIALNQRLSDRPLTFTLKKPDSKLPIELLLQAENLGEIAPNTGIMIIEANNKRYEVRVNSDFQKHAVILISFTE